MHTEIGNARAFVFGLGGDTEDGCNGGEGRRNDLVVEDLRREGSHGGATRRPPRQGLLARLRHCCVNSSIHQGISRQNYLASF